MKTSRLVISVATIISLGVVITTGVSLKSLHVDKSAMAFDSRVQSGDTAPVADPQDLDPCSVGILKVKDGQKMDISTKHIEWNRTGGSPSFIARQLAFERSN